MFYIGAHQTKNLDDGYIGSGKILKHAIAKYGKENFKSEILYLLSSKEEMFSLEREIVNEAFVNDPLTYNLKIGGSGGNPGIVGAFTGRTHTAETKEKMRQASLKQITTDEKRRKLSKPRSKEVVDRISKSLTGRTLSDEHRDRLAAVNVGKIIVNNGTVGKRISESELSEFLTAGWVVGGMPRKNVSR